MPAHIFYSSKCCLKKTGALTVRVKKTETKAKHPPGQAQRPKRELDARPIF